MLRDFFSACENWGIASVLGLCVLSAPINGICLERSGLRIGKVGSSDTIFEEEDKWEASDEEMALII
ncbi:MAG: hypothetical protein K2X08_06695 [Chlamydiales bacterium]|nr:hypothetical protein [Chlamydiales bacterium]